jgi:hypothetical protein
MSNITVAGGGPHRTVVTEMWSVSRRSVRRPGGSYNK